MSATEQLPTLVELASRARRGRRGRGPGAFGGTTETVDEKAALARGVFAERLDKGYLEGPLGWLLYRDSPDESARRWGLEVFQALALAVLPEEYGDDPNAAGLVPRGGGKRVGADRLVAFVELVVRGRTA